MKRRILVVDDNLATATRIRHCLSWGDFDVLEAPSGTTAIARCQDLAPGVVVVSEKADAGLLRDLRQAGPPDLRIIGLLDDCVVPAGLDTHCHLVTESLLACLFPLLMPPLPPPLPGKGRAVVVAEDDAVRREALRLELERQGFEVFAVPNGRIALRRAREHSVDAVASDVMMPELDGFSLALAMRRDPRLRDIPLVLFSDAYGDPADAEMARRCGAHAYVLKSDLFRDEVSALLQVFQRLVPPGATGEGATDRERLERVEQQLERQIGLVEALTARSRRQEIQLALLSGVTEDVLKNATAEQAVEHMLRRCVDFGEIRAGAVLRADERVVAQAGLAHLSLDRADLTRIPLEPSGTLVVDVDSPGEFLQALARHLSLALALTDAMRERDQATNQLVQAQKMEAVGRLSGGIAHDFNNLLTAIMGYSELLQMDVAPDDPRCSSLEEIRKAAERGAALTGQLLAFSRKQVLAPRRVSLNDMVESVQRMLERVIGEDVVLETVLRKDVAPVLADPNQLDQVLMNLAVNARDAMPRGGRLTLETANFTLAEPQPDLDLPPGRYAMLRVSDTGSGIAPDILDRIFDPFFTTKEIGKGTGLGLSTVFGIVKQSEGHVSVRSEPGVGTTFTVYLPQLDDLAVAAPPSQGREALRGAGERVLLVEDERMLRTMTASMLTSLGYRVVTAASAQEALGLFEEGFDLVMTDVVMPGLSGRELAERLLARRPGTRVLFMSGYTDDAVMRHGVLTDRVEFLQKPYTLLTLSHKLREVLEGLPKKPSG